MVLELIRLVFVGGGVGKRRVTKIHLLLMLFFFSFTENENERRARLGSIVALALNMLVV